MLVHPQYHFHSPPLGAGSTLHIDIPHLNCATPFHLVNFSHSILVSLRGRVTRRQNLKTIGIHISSSRPLILVVTMIVVIPPQMAKSTKLSKFTCSLFGVHVCMGFSDTFSVDSTQLKFTIQLPFIIIHLISYSVHNLHPNCNNYSSQLTK